MAVDMRPHLGPGDMVSEGAPLTPDLQPLATDRHSHRQTDTPYSSNKLDKAFHCLITIFACGTLDLWRMQESLNVCRNDGQNASIT